MTAEHVGQHYRIRNSSDSHSYVIAHAADHNFSGYPLETAFEPAARRFTIQVPAKVHSGEFRISVMECAGDQRSTHSGARNADSLEVHLAPATEAVILAVRLGAGADVELGRPTVRILDLETQIYGPHTAREFIPGLSSTHVRAHLSDTLPIVKTAKLSPRVEAFLQKRRFEFRGHPSLAFSDGRTWETATSRAHQRMLHGFIFLAEWSGALLSGQADAAELKRAFGEVIGAWVRRFGGARPADAPMAWHDETTAQRVLSVLSFVETCGWDLPDGVDHLVRDILEPAAAVLFTEDFHETGNNHGMFQDFALLAYAALAPYPTDAQRHRMAARAISRLDDYFSSSFTSEGVHVENSPSYHLMASQYLKQYASTLEAMDHPRAGAFHDMVDHAAEYAIHCVMPDGIHPPISDTKQRPLDSTVHAHLFEAAEYRFAVTGGRTGTEPAERTLVLPETGYAIHRTSWGDPQATFLFFSAAYNADYHKHSDDLSIFVRSRGFDLLCESGPYGYDYQHPFSKYAYSQFSHNSLVVDGVSLPRTDGKFDAVTLSQNSSDAAVLDVTGTNSRYNGISHERRLQVHESANGVRMTVLDSIISDSEHGYELIWNLGPEIRSTVTPVGFDLRSPGTELASAVITSETPWAIKRFAAADSPSPRGWRFPDFGRAVPSQQLSVRFQGSHVTMQTEFMLLPAG
ncbi:heparinase II/III domain-containing protein [Kocuria palustris]|uniref:heparinase II/III domain-containing protein n=1 Tax=Kocuria palustris TaxID=71999 RepID=UPI003D71A2EA